MGRPAAPLPMDGGQRRALRRIVGSGRASSRQARRARALLQAADGLSNVQVARLCEVAPATVHQWRIRFQQGGVRSVLQSSAGRMPSVDAAFVPGGDQFLCGLYLGPIERVAVWSDEAASRSIRPRRVYADQRAHDHHDFLRFLRAVEIYTPDEPDVHLLLAECSSHTRHEVDLWLSNAKRRRFVLSETDPARWFELTRRWVREVGAGRATGQWVLRPASADQGRWPATAPLPVAR